MNRSIPLLVLPVSALALLLAACSGRPEPQISRTEQALQQAKEERAQEFAPKNWGPAEEAYNQAQTMLTQKKWREATTLLLKAQAGFQKARDVAKVKRASFMRDVQSTHGTAEDRCKELKEFYKANLSSIPSAKRKELEDTYKGFDEKLAKVTSQLGQGQYRDAKLLAEATLRELWEAQEKLEKLTGKKIHYLAHVK
jgi:hypothetical protein